MLEWINLAQYFPVYDFTNEQRRSQVLLTIAFNQIATAELKLTLRASNNRLKALFGATSSQVSFIW